MTCLFVQPQGDTEESVGVDTTAGRVLFNEIVPPELGFLNETMDKKRLRELVSTTHREVSPERTVTLVEAIKDGKADAVLCASIFHYGQHTVEEAKIFMAANGVPVRI